MRHHPIEYLITAAFYWLAVVAFGIPVIVVTSHAVAVFTAAAIIHGNIRELTPSLATVRARLVERMCLPGLGVS